VECGYLEEGDTFALKSSFQGFLLNFLANATNEIMTSETIVDIKTSITKKKLQYNKSIGDYLNDLLPTTLLILIDIFLTIQLLVNSDEGLKTLAIIGVLISIVTLVLAVSLAVYNRLDLLKEIKIKGSKNENKELSKAIANTLGWILLKETSDYLIYRRRWGLINSGENITIIPYADAVLLNSNTYPVNDVTRTTLSFGANKKNIRKFERLIQGN